MVLATGTRISSNDSSAVSEARLPSLFSFRLTRKPGTSVGTRICVIPRYPPSSDVRASRQTQSAWVPLVM